MSELLPTARVRGDGAGAGADIGPRDEARAVERIVLAEGVSMAVRPTGGLLVVELSGIADGSWAESLVLELLARGEDQRMVIDLNEVTLVNPASVCQVVEQLVAAGSDPHRVCLVCERLSAVVLLRRCGASELAAIFASAADAIQAALHEAAGYGDGWAPIDAH